MSSPPKTLLVATAEEQNKEFWIERWDKNTTPWDQKSAHPTVIRFLHSDTADTTGIPKGAGRAFIPGCGTGYDVQLFAERGMESVGLEVSDNGVLAARSWLETQPSTSGTVEVVQADFFNYDPPKLFDVIYDYTFLCALEPPFRQSWSKTLKTISKPSQSARLITLMYPLNGNPGGPPFALSEEVYHELLDEDWDLIHLEAVPEAEERKIGVRSGDSKLGVWARR